MLINHFGERWYTKGLDIKMVATVDNFIVHGTDSLVFVTSLHGYYSQ